MATVIDAVGVNLGSMEIALAIGLTLFGIVLTQGYTYFRTCEQDRISLKALAAVILFLEVGHSVVMMRIIYESTVLDSWQLTIGLGFPMGVVLETLITVLVQSFFAYRIYRLSGTLYISIVCWTFSLLRFGGGLAIAVAGFLQVVDYANKLAWLVTLMAGVGVFVDVLVAASMCYYLKRLSPPDPLTSTSALVHSLMMWIIQTGLMTGVASVALVITFQVLRTTLVWYAIYAVMAKLYSNSFFVLVNIRHRPADLELLSSLQFRSTRHELDMRMAHGAQEGNAETDLYCRGGGRVTDYEDGKNKSQDSSL